jgi:hypothetical protein
MLDTQTTTRSDPDRPEADQSWLAQAQRIVKYNPGPTLLMAAVLGFLAARAFLRDQRN